MRLFRGQIIPPSLGTPDPSFHSGKSYVALPILVSTFTYLGGCPLGCCWSCPSCMLRSLVGGRGDLG